MDPLLIVLLVVLALIVIVGIWLWATYNGLVTARVRVDEAWSDITVQLKRRADLIPNLVQSVKGYAAHEKGVLEGVTQARSQLMAADGPAETAQAENALNQTLRSLFAVAESYPQLQANQNFLQLQGELVDSEDKVQAARRFYNGGVRELNTRIQKFPANVVAGMFHFVSREFFEVADPAVIQEPPRVQF